MPRGYTIDEIKENGWNVDNFGQCQECLQWFPIGELCEREDEDGVEYCDSCR